MTETKIVELIIQDENQELAIDAISLVTSPAIEQDFVFFGKEKNNLTFAKVDEEKRMLVSPALIPNKNIFRHDPNTDSDYYVYFSKETVRKASELYLKHNNHHKATYQHQDRVSGVLTVESWIKEGDSDKSKLYGYDLPNGTWFVKMKIENDELWQKIKAGELKGLSIEGYFTNKFEQMQKTKPTTKEILSAFNELVREGKITTMSKAKRFQLGELQDLKSFTTKAVNKSVIAKKAASDLNMESNELEGLSKRYEDKIADIKTMKKDALSSRGTADKAMTRMEDAFQEMKALQVKAGQIINNMKVVEKELGINVPGLQEAESKLDGMDETRNIVEKNLSKAQKAYGKAAPLFR